MLILKVAQGYGPWDGIYVLLNKGWSLIDFDDTKTLLICLLIKLLSVLEVCLEPKAKASLKGLRISYQMEGFESLSAKCKQNRIWEKRFESLRKRFESLNLKFEQKVCTKKMIRIFKARDLNPSREEVKTLEKRLKDPNSRQNDSNL